MADTPAPVFPDPYGQADPLKGKRPAVVSPFMAMSNQLEAALAKLEKTTAERDKARKRLAQVERELARLKAGMPAPAEATP